MRTFTGSWANRIMLVFWLVMGCAVVCFGVAILLRARDTSVKVGTGLFFLLGGGFGAMSVAGLLESFTTYLVDRDGITRRAWNGTRAIRWNEIARCESNGQRDGSLALLDEAGRKTTVHFYLLGGKQRDELRALLEPHLASARDRQQREVSLPGMVYYPGRNMAWSGATMLILIGVMVVYFSSMPPPADQRIFFYGVIAFLGAGFLFFAAFTAAMVTDSLTFTEQGITQRRWFRVYEMAFHHVTSVTSRIQTVRGGSWDVTVIEGDGHEVMFTSRMPDYPVIVAFVDAHTDRKAGEQAAVASGAAKQKDPKIPRAGAGR